MEFLKVRTITPTTIQPNYKFIVSYPDKTITYEKSELDDLLMNDEIKVLSWFVFKGFKSIVDVSNYLKEQGYKDTLYEKLFEFFDTKNFVQFDMPTHVKLIKVDQQDNLLEEYKIRINDNDIKEIIYNDFIKPISDEQIKYIEECCSEYEDADLVVKKSFCFHLNNYNHYIGMNDYLDEFSRFDQIKLLIDKILITANVLEVTNIEVEDGTKHDLDIKLTTDKGIIKFSFDFQYNY